MREKLSYRFAAIVQIVDESSNFRSLRWSPGMVRHGLPRAPQSEAVGPMAHN